METPTGQAPPAESAADRPAAGRSRVSAVAIYLGLLAAALFTGAQSLLAPWSRGDLGVDQAVFFYEGSRVLAGEAPYVDFFDHKGPLIFLVNALGGALGGTGGVWLLEVACLFAAAVICLKGFAPLFGRPAAALTAASLVLLSGNCFDGGNLTEEYCWPLGMVAMALTVRFALTRRIGAVAAATMGATGAAAFMFRPTDLALWAVLCLAILIALLVAKRVREALAAGGWFLVGFAAVAGPLIAWLAVKGALWACFEQMILFNAEYAERKGLRHMAYAAIQLSGGFDFTLAATVTAGLTIWLRVRGRGGRPARPDLAFLAAANLVAAAALFALIVYPGRPYPHYMMQLLPCYALPFGFVWHGATRLLARRSLVPAAVAGLAALVLAWGSLWPAVRSGGARAVAVAVAVRSPVLEELVAVVEANSRPDEPIQVYGSQSWIYLATDRTAATRYHYQPFSYGTPPDLLAEVLDLVRDARPAVIVDTNGGLMATGYNLEDYELVFDTDDVTTERFQVYALRD